MDSTGPVQIEVFTKWPEVYGITNCTASETINKLSTVFSCFRVSENSVTDKCSQFILDSFKHFCSIYEITHLRSPLYHPRSNEQAEIVVDTFKIALMKGEDERTTSQVIIKFLTTYKTTPNPTVLGEKSPD